MLAGGFVAGGGQRGGHRAVDVVEEFFARGAAEIERTGDAYVMPARMPRMALAQFGLPVNPARAGEAIDTELLIRPDGAVLALRFVN